MKKGFTLIELLIVVLIVGILATVAMPQYTKVVDKARLVEVKTSLRAIGDAIHFYYMETGRYPSNANPASSSTELLITVADTPYWHFNVQVDGQAVAYSIGDKPYLNITGADEWVLPDGSREYMVYTVGSGWGDFLDEWPF
ncbi:MAG: prepilin-type N-terminal cleavage/methylation domain-containing protein [Candidatus Omnitrophica bacterium]|nr:prepilin-type N-terminal cleavage/methylation domain-containing protein [Candidatus Omnitrophota bacterium]